MQQVGPRRTRAGRALYPQRAARLARPSHGALVPCRGVQPLPGADRTRWVAVLRSSGPVPRRGARRKALYNEDGLPPSSRRFFHEAGREIRDQCDAQMSVARHAAVNLWLIAERRAMLGGGFLAPRGTGHLGHPQGPGRRLQPSKPPQPPTCESPPIAWRQVHASAGRQPGLILDGRAHLPSPAHLLLLELGRCSGASRPSSRIRATPARKRFPIPTSR